MAHRQKPAVAKENEIVFKQEEVIRLKERRGDGWWTAQLKDGSSVKVFLMGEVEPEPEKDKGEKEKVKRKLLDEITKKKKDKKVDKKEKKVDKKEKEKAAKLRRTKSRTKLSDKPEISSSEEETDRDKRRTMERRKRNTTESSPMPSREQEDPLQAKAASLRAELTQLQVELLLAEKTYLELCAQQEAAEQADKEKEELRPDALKPAEPKALTVALHPQEKIFQRLLHQDIFLEAPRPLLYREVLLAASVLNGLQDLDEDDRTALTTLEFNVFPMKDANREDMLFVFLLQMFKELNLVEHFAIPSLNLYRFLLTLSRRYRNVPFHNFYHAFNVTQTLYHLLVSNNVAAVLEPTELFALIIATLCHDCDHPGLNNDFQKKAKTHISRLYNNTSVLENHHCLQTTSLLAKEECNLFVNVSTEQEEQIRQHITMCILATDLALHGVILGRLNARGKLIAKAIQTGQLLDQEDRELVMVTLVKCADISNEIRPKSIAKKWAHLVIEEFFAQSKVEQAKGLPTAAFMDKTKIIIPQEQINFISKLCMPLYQAAVVFFPNMQHCCDTMNVNQEGWQHVMDTFFSEQGATAYSHTSIWEREQVSNESKGSLSSMFAGRARGLVGLRKKNEEGK